MHMRFVLPVSILFLVLLLLPAGGQAQQFPRDPGTGSIVFAEEVLVMDGPKTDLYRRARAWLLKNSHPSRALLADEEANGVLIGRSFAWMKIMDQNQARRYKLWYTLKIEVENDRFWYRCYDLEVQQAGPAPAIEKPGQALENFLPDPAGTKPKKQPPAGPAALPAQAHASLLALFQDLQESMR
ncbi:MAG: DUF4468 domain-containing protein [Adhaeribacter sp.]